MTGRFTHAFKDALADYLKFLLGQFELSDWRITLRAEPPEGPDAAASIESIYGRRVADLKLALDFFDNDQEKQEHYLIHEVGHLFSEGIDSVIQNGPETLMGKPAYTMFYEAYRVQMELMTDQLAYVLGDLLGGEQYDRLLTALIDSEKDPIPAEPEPERRVDP